MNAPYTYVNRFSCALNTLVGTPSSTDRLVAGVNRRGNPHIRLPAFVAAAEQQRAVSVIQAQNGVGI